MLWGLERLLERFSSPVAIVELKASFRNPLPLKTLLTLESLEFEAGEFKIRFVGDYCGITGRLGDSDDADLRSAKLPEEAPALESEDLSLREAAQATGSIPLYLDEAQLQSMFPSLAKNLPAVQVAQILATTRLTGMRCPGRRSAFHALELRFAAGSGEAEMHYRVCGSDERFSVLHLAVGSPGLEGKLSTFVRPLPVRQPSFSEATKHVSPGEFQGQRALIVGGSRGLGELAAKIVAAGGGAVRLTYHQGKEEAQQIVREIDRPKADCGCFCLDVTHRAFDSLREGLGDWHPTHLYYFATPHIGRPQNRASFAPREFRRFCRYYIEGFSSVLEALAPSRGSPLAVFYPSTDLLDTLRDGRVEYTTAKAAGEHLCRVLEQQSPTSKFHVPRLPRMRTDQTVSIGPQSLEDSLDTMLAEIRRFESVSSATDLHATK